MKVRAGQAGRVGDVVEDVGGVGAREPARAVQIAVLLRSSGIDGANASNPLLMEWAENKKVTDDLLQTAVGMVKARNEFPIYRQRLTRAKG